jgi:ribosomal protein S18 acetylase RimI-like enzyme
MNYSKLTHRKATINDLRRIIELLIEDELGQTREFLDKNHSIDPNYLCAFENISRDPNQYLMVVEQGNQIIGTCHLSLIPSLTFKGSMRLNIEAVHVDQQHRGQGVGTWMMKQAITDGKLKGAYIIQLTTNKKRLRAKPFYEKLGFQASHEGMKLYL